MLLYDSVLYEYSGGGNLALIDVDISQMSTAILESYGPGIVYVEDAIERLLDEIDYINKRIFESDLGHEELWKQGLEDPLALDYNKYHRELEANREHYIRTKDILQKDLAVLIDAEVPF